MKLFKFEISNQIGNWVITVPTDSQFLIGMTSCVDPDAEIRLFDGETEIPAESDKLGKFTCFKLSTNETPCRKTYRGVIAGSSYSKTVSILVICKETSVVERDVEQDLKRLVDETTGDGYELAMKGGRLVVRRLAPQD